MKIGLQTYSVRNRMAADPVGTMRAVAAMGYKNWELAPGFDGNRPHNFGLYLPLAEGQALLKELDVTIIGNHVPWDAESCVNNMDALREFLDYQAGIGCASPGVAMDFFNSLDEVKRKVDFLHIIAEECRKRGMGFHYHNHYQEFKILDGKYAMDWIVELSDPALVDVELDTYWAMCGGADPLELIPRYAGRLKMLHQKDFPKDRPYPVNQFEHNVNMADELNMDVFVKNLRGDSFTEVGHGIMDIQAIIDAGNKAGVEYLTLEQDITTLDELDSVALSKESLEKMTGVQW